MKTSTINYVKIEKLYGHKSFNVELIDNQLIIVGENGLGKSTVINILFYTLTSQWQKLLKYQFHKIEVGVNGKSYSFTMDDINSVFDKVNENSYINLLFKLKNHNLTAKQAYLSFSSDIYRKLRNDSFSEPARLRRALMELADNKLTLDHLPKSLLKLESALNFHVLYLPTYRRIERDLKQIFPSLEEDLQKYNRYHSSISRNREHVELVEFGMQDVQSMISLKMNQLENEFRSSLERLTSGYLRVILRKEYKEESALPEYKFNDQELDSIFEKIERDGSFFSRDDLKNLRNTAHALNEGNLSSDIDMLSAHLIKQLLNLHKNQLNKEDKVRTFAKITNSYLKGKKFDFNSKEFRLPLVPDFENEDYVLCNSTDEIDLSQLSSGEKQIVSLFAHMYLSDFDDFLVIIDEPELSLSVPWQKRLLVDITSTENCNGLIAVTHSPFVYNNSLKSKAKSLMEFYI
ncbi:AAA family ATPase [Aeromonas enteropelogenes]|uniref:AAA family ATPase n=1 Tax=Aeromonas enteropelogenes TaxID=29489 RepID=UPI0009E34D77|nr:AAA family ATPase [Aeromonas enteropelogenes]UBH51686.1 ATP-binding protein [Aeromonas enteropelogenes]